MMNQKELIEYAMKGLLWEIRKREASIREGNRLLDDLAKGKKVTTKMSASEIREVIRQKEEEIEELDSKRFRLEWELSVEMKV